jgi:hypothetical protein
MAIEEIDSLFRTGALVTIDPWSLNSLADDLQAASPTSWALALGDGQPPPKMFSDGREDLPAFTASGIDPQRLLDMPARTRHFLAADADLADVYSRFEQDQNNPHAAYAHGGLDAAVQRLNAWVRGQGTDALVQQQQRDALQAERQRQLTEVLMTQGDRAYFALQDKFAAQDRAANAVIDQQLAAMGWANGRFGATTLVNEA